MNEQYTDSERDAFFVRSIKECYRAQVGSLHSLPSDSGKDIYQVNLTNGNRWVLRVVDDAGKEPCLELVHLLLFFEQQHYPAERLILTAQQEVMATVDGWHLLMTTFLAGAPVEPTPASFFALGATVGRLHALKASLPPELSPAKMLPSRELAFAQHQLEAVADRLPRASIARYDLLINALMSLNRGTHLPTTLIHNDCHPANARLTAPGQVALIDWEDAGMGAAVLDVGFFLVSCDSKAPWVPLSDDSFHLNKDLIQAIIEGYNASYQLTADELEYLPDAIRFRSLVFGACRFASALAQQESTEFSQWWWKQYSMAEELAELARGYFE